MTYGVNFYSLFFLLVRYEMLMSCMFATQSEIDQYIRMTLRQHKMEEVKVSFKKMSKTLGYFWAEKNHICLSYLCLSSFVRFKETFLHELAHKLDFAQRGTFQRNGRNDFHGKNFKRICLTLGIPARRFIP